MSLYIKFYVVSFLSNNMSSERYFFSNNNSAVPFLSSPLALVHISHPSSTLATQDVFLSE